MKSNLSERRAQGGQQGASPLFLDAFGQGSRERSLRPDSVPDCGNVSDGLPQISEFFG